MGFWTTRERSSTKQTVYKSRHLTNITVHSLFNISCHFCSTNTNSHIAFKVYKPTGSIFCRQRLWAYSSPLFITCSLSISCKYPVCCSSNKFIVTRSNLATPTQKTKNMYQNVYSTSRNKLLKSDLWQFRFFVCLLLPRSCAHWKSIRNRRCRRLPRFALNSRPCWKAKKPTKTVQCYWNRSFGRDRNEAGRRRH
jgi:hypothetical protein